MVASGLCFYNVVVDCEDAISLSRFWAAALGWQTRRQDEGWSTITDPNDPSRRIAFNPVPESKTIKNRLHFDLLPKQGVTRLDERARLESLGAQLTRTVYEDELVAHDIMADPQGNEFCLLEPYPEYFDDQE